MLNFIYKLQRTTPLRVKILVATIMVVVTFSGVFLYQTLYFQTERDMNQVAESSQNLLENTYSAIKYPMSIGDSKTVEQQLKDIKDHMKGVEVYISDFHQIVQYASEEERIHTGIQDYLLGKETREALTGALRSGLSPQKSITEIRDGDPFLVTIMPLLNESSCHHCHGASQKVLGAMVVKHPVKKVYSSLASARNRLIGFSIIEIIGIILVINFLFNRLVTRRIKGLAEKTGLVSAGDITVEVHDDSQDSIGRLTRNFNQMIKNIHDRIEYANSLKLCISDPLVIVDPDMKLTYMNDAAAKLAGVRPEEVVGKKTCEEVFRSDLCRTECPIKKSMETEEATVGSRVTMKNAEGKEIPILTSAAALRDSAGKILGGFEIMRNISKEVEADRHMKELIGQTKKAALTVIRGVRQISEGNQELSQRTQQQAATVEETSATVEQLVSNINQNATNTQRAETLSKDAVAVAVEGGETVEKTTQAMNDMSEGSRKIVEMMDLINEITFQTNLLSINAAVEAARAGEHGLGFAVVASEVRSLAKRSSKASKDIQNLVRDIMDQVNTGKEWVSQLENGFNKIVQTIKQVSDALSEVSLATQESLGGIKQIGQAVYQLSGVAEQNSSLVDQLSGATEQLNEKAGLLQDMTDKFTLGDQDDIEVEEFSFNKSIQANKNDRRGTQPPATRSLREMLATQHPIEEKPEDLLEKELDGGFEEF